MDHQQLSWLLNFIWNMADDVLRAAFGQAFYNIPALEQEAEGLRSEITVGSRS